LFYQVDLGTSTYIDRVQLLRRTDANDAVFNDLELTVYQDNGAGQPGAVAFQLYDTYGFPIDLTVEMAGERALQVDMAAYEAAMEEQRERARKAARFVPMTRRTSLSTSDK